VNKKTLKTLLKIGISILLLYFVFTKIDVAVLREVYQNLNFGSLLLAILLFVLSQLISSLRLNYIFHSNKLPLSQISNLKLYFIGMFYNFFIPGGIGGDAYKVYLLKKQLGWDVKAVTKSLLIDRLIGLVAIFTLLSLISSVIFLEANYFVIVGTFIGILIYFLSQTIFTTFFKDVKIFFLKSFMFSLFIQFLQLASVWAIVKSFGYEVVNYINYFFVFLTSSVLSVVSFAGFGAREYVFLKSSEFLNTNPSYSTSIGLGFNLITAIISFIGIIFIVSRVKLTTKD